MQMKGSCRDRLTARTFCLVKVSGFQVDIPMVQIFLNSTKTELGIVKQEGSAHALGA